MLIWTSIFSEVFFPVSYTHLDVYKRQVLLRRGYAYEEIRRALNALEEEEED